MKPTKRPKPVVLIILDGWGHRTSRAGNAIKSARTPTFDWLDRHASKTTLRASGKDVGLPHGFQGNSEVGHITLGAGRIVKEMMVEIDDSIKDRSFFYNKALKSAITNCKKHRSALHLMGLVQDEGVHAMSSHAFALLNLAKQHGLKEVWLHFFTDGRDTPPRSAKKFVTSIMSASNRLKIGRPATLVGRYFAMDRDHRWDRTKKAFDLIVSARGVQAQSPVSAIGHAYRQGQSDEFITPRVFPGYTGIAKNDSVIFFNYRLDRARQLTRAFVDKKFKPWKRQGEAIIKSGSAPMIHFVAMTRYFKELPSPVAFESPIIRNNLAQVLSTHKIRQLRVAETEKYAHVTYFFNSEVEPPVKGEDRVLIPSPRVATYDSKPEMSAPQITRVVIDAVKKRRHDVIIMNIANGDMVGHTGNFAAAKQAVEVVDSCVGRLIDAVGGNGGLVLITADHGNCEQKSGLYRTSHTRNPVPCYLVGKNVKLRKGGLCDVAPTLLKLLGIPKPKEMTGNSLF